MVRQEILEKLIHKKGKKKKNRQTLVEYNSSVKTYLSESSLKVYSPEFQTIFQNKDLYGHNEASI